MKKALIIFGTRPEAIKMAPVIHAAENSGIEAITCATAQHREMLDQVNEFFGITPDYDLNLMQPKQDLFDVTVYCLSRIRQVLQKVKPDVVLVQGDTTTTFAAALGAFYERIPVGHIEAGLRTGDISSPFPEEGNRRMVSPLASYHFAPTEQAMENLMAENVPSERIFLTGNTSIDALSWGSEQSLVYPELGKLYGKKPMVLMTAHRRENFGEPIRNIMAAVRRFFMKRSDLHLIYPVHPNPNVKSVAEEMLGDIPNVSLISPVDYSELIFLLRSCQFVLTDSGGLQEEAPTLGKPVLVLRETTERPEAVLSGCAELVGHDSDKIIRGLETLSDMSSAKYQSMSQAVNPFGDGTAAKQIIRILERELGAEEPLYSISANSEAGASLPVQMSL